MVTLLVARRWSNQIECVSFEYIQALAKHGITILLYQMSLNNCSVPHLAEQEHTRFAEIHESTNGLLPYPKRQNQLRQLCLSPSDGVAPASGCGQKPGWQAITSLQKKTTFKRINKQVCKSKRSNRWFQDSGWLMKILAQQPAVGILAEGGRSISRSN